MWCQWGFCHFSGTIPLHGLHCILDVQWPIVNYWVLISSISIEHGKKGDSTCSYPTNTTLSASSLSSCFPPLSSTCFTEPDSFCHLPVAPLVLSAIHSFPPLDFFNPFSFCFCPPWPSVLRHSVHFFLYQLLHTLQSLPFPLSIPPATYYFFHFTLLPFPSSTSSYMVCYFIVALGYMT